MNKIISFIVLIILIAPVSLCPALAEQGTQPYFRVKYEIPRIPEGVASKDAAAKNLALYKQHLLKNKRIIAEKQRQLKDRELFANQHNEITVNLLKDDRREYIRFKPSDCPKLLTVTIFPNSTNGKISGLTIKPKDISRGGLGFTSNVIKVNDELPVKIKYGNTEINTTLKVVSSANGRVGGKFVKLNEKTSNQLIYLSSVLESDNGLLKTKLSPM